MKRRFLFTGIILAGGILIASGVLAFVNINGVAPAKAYSSISSMPSRWTQSAGEGISVPACAAAGTPTAAVTCSGGNPLVTFNWDVTNFALCERYPYVGIWYMPPGYTSFSPYSALLLTYVYQCPVGTYNWTGAANNTTYYWGIGYPDPYTGSYHSGGDGVLSTPNCTPPTADIKANGSDGPISISYNTPATISWSSTNATSCSVSPTGWAGTSGSKSSGNLTSSQTYALSCTGPGGSVSDSVVVNVNPPPPTADIKVNGSDGPITISYNTSATVSWSSTNATSCSVSPTGWTGISGSQSSGNLTSPQTYTLSCTGPSGQASDSATVNVSAAPVPSANLSANPTSIIQGQSSTLSWSTANVTSCSIDNGVGSVSTSGSTAVSPSSTTTYTLNCSGAYGSVSSSATVSVVPSLTASCSVSPASATVGQNVTWSASASGGSGSYSYSWSGTDGLSGTAQSVTTSYSTTGNKTGSITLTSGGQTVTQACSNSVTVTPSPVPTASLTAAPTSIIQGQSSTLSWSTANVTSCSIDNGVGSVPVSGSTSVYPSATTTYTLSCTGPYGPVQSSTTVSVSPQTLSVALTANPNTGTSPLSSTLTASVSGSAFGTINYSFWWNCSNTTTSVSSAETACGSLPAPSPGTCVTNTNGAKCDAISETSESVTNTYSGGTYTPKVIVERGVASSAEDRQTVTVNWPAPDASCSVSPGATYVNNLVTWSASASGGNGTYSYSWSGTDGLSGNSASVSKSYTTSGTKTGSITVTSAGQTVTRACSNSVDVTYPPICIGPCGGGGGTGTFIASPASINPGGSSTLSWSSSNAASCSIDQGIGSVPTTGSVSVSPTTTTTYTISCTGPGGSATAQTTITVSGIPTFKEVVPE